MARSLVNTGRRTVAILLVEAVEEDAASIQSLLPGMSGLDCEWHCAADLEAAALAFGTVPVDVVILSLGLPGCKGVEALKRIRAMAPDKPVVVVTAVEDEELGVEAVQAGAHEYLVKDQMESRTAARIVRYAIERQRVEAQLRVSLLEKETLLREVHHRVKNNLQVILSLLRLGSENLPAGEARRIFQDSHNRIRSMSMIHEALYQSRDISKVPFSGYVKELMRELFCAHNAWARGIEMDLQIAPLELGIDTAIPCGLILHELVTNSLEHAFPVADGGQAGREGDRIAGGRKWVQVIFRRVAPERLQLQVSDNGIGLPPEGEWRKKKSIGLNLVVTLAGQLGGTVEYELGPPALCGILFPEKRSKGPLAG